MASVPSRVVAPFVAQISAYVGDAPPIPDLPVEGWCLAPHAVGLGEAGEDGLGSRLKSSLRWRMRSFSARSGPLCFHSGPYLFVSTSGQNMRVLQPVMDAVATANGPFKRVQLPTLSPREAFVAARRARIAARVLVNARRDSGDGALRGFEEVAHTTSIHLQRLRKLLGSIEPRLVVVASQHNSVSRAVLAATAEAGIPSAYLPHAPAADNFAYRDLPVSYALLRGPNEVAFYRALGAPPGHLFDVGDPSIEFEDSTAFDPEGPVVVAGTVAEPGVIECYLRVVADVGLPEVIFRPHPRALPETDAPALRAGWRVVRDQSTFETIQNVNPSAVIQIQSGVGLEALRLGVPLVNLRQLSDPAAYPYLESSFVANVASTEELRSALLALREDASSPDDRHRYALAWSSATGPAAAERAAAVLASCLEESSLPTRVLDLWGQGLQPVGVDVRKVELP